jgi:rubrerythrin
MVQYLYAAYSLRADKPPADKWRETLLLIAREEMAHLLTVQNILALLGGPYNLDREDYPYDVPFDAFPFQLERLTKGSLACYVYAEMPPGKEIEAIKNEAERHIGKGARFNHVGTLYSYIVQILADHSKIADNCFRGTDFGQMSWDEWGRSYQGEKKDTKNGKKRQDRHGHDKAAASGSHVAHALGATRADLLIRKVITREQAIVALAELSEQGEGLVAVEAELDTGPNPLRTLKPYIPEIKDEDTHYGRFLEIYNELGEYEDSSQFSWDVPPNPVCDFSRVPPARDGTKKVAPADGAQDEQPVKITQIENKCSRRWAALFNVRYRMLLNWLAHVLTLARRDPPPPTFQLRGQIMHRVFGEMYNLKALAELIVRMPLKEGGDPDKDPHAGPPFQMPYRAALPPSDRDIWALHQQVIAASRSLCDELLLGTKDEPACVKDDSALRRFLLAMQDADKEACSWINGVLAGLDK